MRKINICRGIMYCVLICFGLASLPHGHAQTTSGSLTADETWSGTISVTGDVTVPAGVTLTIAAGTTVRFSALNDDQGTGANGSRAELIVNGALVAQGTADQPVVLTSASADPQKGDWYGLRVVANAYDASLSLSHCTIEYSSLGLRVEADGFDATLSLADSIIQQSAGDGIHMTGENGAQLVLDVLGSTITGHNGHGVYAFKPDDNSRLSGRIVDSTIGNNGGHGIYLFKGGDGFNEVDILGNTIHDNQDYGIYLRSYATYAGRSVYRIENNEIQRSGTGVYCWAAFSGMTVSLVGNQVHGGSKGIYCYSDDYYGRTTAAIDVLIADNDIYDNSSEGILCRTEGGRVHPQIRANRIYSNGGDGIRTVYYRGRALTPVITLNEIYDNSAGGINCQASAAVDVFYNDIRNNTGIGFYLAAGNGSRVHFNNLHGNGGAYDLQNGNGSSIDAQFNYWGTTATDQMESGGNIINVDTIHDINDDRRNGSVNYSHWLDTAISTAEASFSNITNPVPGTTLNHGELTLRGLAYARSGIDKVELSLDGGANWESADVGSDPAGVTLWQLSLDDLEDGQYTVLSRAVDQIGVTEAEGDSTTFSIDYTQFTSSGALAGNENWSGTIHLDGDVTVPAGVTLTILPGTVVYLPALLDAANSGLNTSKAELTIDGSLIAEGTPAKPVIFTSSRTVQGQKGDWAGIRVNGSIRLKHAVVEYGDYGVQCSADDSADNILIAESTIRHNAGDGIQIYAENNAGISPSIIDNRIASNDGRGVYIHAYGGSTAINAKVCRNTVTENGVAGIYWHADGASGEPSVTGDICSNTVTGHSDQGIYGYTHDGAVSQIAAVLNVVSTSGTGIYTHYDNASPLSTLTINANTVEDGSHGIEVYTDYASLVPEIKNNIVRNNESDGIACWHGSADGHQLLPQLDGNEVIDNGDRGVYLKASGEVVVVNNSLHGNDNYDLYNDSAHNVDADNNWWGADTTTEMIGKPYPSDINFIYDKHDDDSKGMVKYSDWLSSGLKPNPPTINSVTSPTKETTQVISGGKEAGTAVILNGVEIHALDDQTEWSYTMTLEEGDNPIYLAARNADGLSSSVIQASIVRDTTAPVLQSSIPANGAHVPRAVDRISITLIDTDSEVDFAATIQDAAVENQAGQKVPGVWDDNEIQAIFLPEQVLKDDTYTVTIRPTDRPLGNQNQSSFTFTVDLVHPAVPTLNPLTSPTNTTPQTISGQKETDTSVWLGNQQIYALDGSNSWSYSLPLAEGGNDFTLHVRDRAGNKSPEQSFNIVLDRTPPVLISTEPPGDAYVIGDITRIVFNFTDAITLAVAETLATVVLKTASGETIPINAHIQVPGTVILLPVAALAEDTYTASVQARDAVGNTAAAAFSFTFDKTPPAPPTLDPMPTQSVFTRLTLSGTKDADTSIWINGVQIIALTAATTWTHEVTLSEGINLFEIYSKDAAGHRSDAVFGETEYDETAPLPVAELEADGQEIGTVVHLDWTGYEDLAATQADVQYYRIYASDRLFTRITGLEPVTTVSASTYRYTVPQLQRNRTYFFAVVAVDSKNNVNSSVTPVSAVTADNIPPAEVTGLAAEGFADRLRFSWTSPKDTHSDLAGYRIYIDGSPTPIPLTPAETSYEITGLELSSSRHFRITTHDNDNNESGGSQITGYTLLANPVITSANSQVGRIKLHWEPSQPSENVKHYHVYFSASDFSSVDSMAPSITTTSTSATMTGLTNGVTYYFAVTAVNFLNGEFKEVDAVSATPVNGTMVSGNITSNKTWTKAGSPYIVTENITVRYASHGSNIPTILTIEPGVKVSFEPGTGIYVGYRTGGYYGYYHGALFAEGTETDPIVFTSNSSSPAPGDWRGIVFRNETDDNKTSLKHCIIEYGGHTNNANLYLANSNPMLENNIIRRSSGYGIYFNGSSPTVSQNIITENDSDGLYLAASSPAILENTITANTGYGIYCENDASAAIEDNIISSNGQSAIIVHANKVTKLKGNSGSGNAKNYIQVRGGEVTSEARWTKQGFPYVITGNVTICSAGHGGSDGPTLTIDPGVQVRFQPGTGFYISKRTGGYYGYYWGALHAQGTEDSPITFTSNAAVPAAGDWRGIYFRDHTLDSKSRLKHCVIEYGGHTNNANIYLANAKPSLSNNIIRQSSGYGIYFNGSSPTVSQNTVTENDSDGIYLATSSPAIIENTITANTGYGIYCENDASAAIEDNIISNNGQSAIIVHANKVTNLKGNSGSGNGQNYIQIRGGEVTSESRWTNQGLPYVITGNITICSASHGGSDGPTLTIEPGVQVRFQPGTGFYISKRTGGYYGYYWGALYAQGTEDAPITFTSNAAVPAAGDWSGIYFRDHTLDSKSRLEHCVIEYGGHTHNANIYLANAKPAVQNSTIRNSSHSGIYVNGSGSNGATMQCNNFKDNYYGVYVVNNASPVIQNNNFLGNQQSGVYNAGTSALAVQNNWWGDSAGPNNAGDHTYGNVSAAPWLTAASDCIASPPANELPFIPTDPLPINTAARVPIIAENQPIPVTLSWTGRDPNPWDVIVYDVYFGTAQSALTTVAENLETNSIDIGDLAEGTTYYWQVIARDDAGAETAGPIWHFTTMGSLPDLVLSEVIQEPSGELEAGMSVNFTARVDNSGTGPVVDKFQITFEIDDSPIGTYQFDTVIHSGESIEINHSWTAQSGDHLIEISIDSQQAVEELNEENNSFTANLTIVAVSDVTGPVVVAEELNGSSLADGNLLFANGKFTMNVEDQSEIYWIEYLLDGDRIKKDFNQATFLECPLDITGLADGDHDLTIEAYDEHFNSTTVSYTIVVNHPPPFECFQECID